MRQITTIIAVGAFQQGRERRRARAETRERERDRCSASTVFVRRSVSIVDAGNCHHTALCRLTLPVCLPACLAALSALLSFLLSALPRYWHSPAEAIISLILSNRCDHSFASIFHSLFLPFNCRLFVCLFTLLAECRSLTLLSALTNNLPRHYYNYNNEMRRQECDCQLPS